MKKGFDFDYENEIVWERYDATVNRIRGSEGYPVTNFRQLMDEVAHVTLSNKNYEMYYRGKGGIIKITRLFFYKERIPKTIIYPSICRPGRNEDGSPKHSIRKVR